MSELQQTIVSRVENNHTYTNTANYWAPLEYNDDEKESGHCLSMTKAANQAAPNTSDDAAVQRDLKNMILSWINQRISKNKPFVRMPSTMVVDSGATSSFVQPEEKLQITGTSQKVVLLPN